MGLVDLLIGLKSSGRTSTKLDGKRPTILLSRRSLPVHHDPSPALRHSIRSPSMKPRSRFDYRHGASARTRRTPGGTRPIPSSRMINTLRGQLFNAPLPRRNTPPCTSKGTAEVCPEEQAPFRRWEDCVSCLKAEIQPTQQHLSPRVGECSRSWFWVWVWVWVRVRIRCWCCYWCTQYTSAGQGRGALLWLSCC